MRYKLVPFTGQISITAVPTPPPAVPKTDLLPTFVSSIAGTADVNASVTLAYAAYDPAAVQAPAETRLYLLAAGSPQPTDGQAFVDSALPCTTSNAAIPAEGVPAFVIQCPPAPVADYAWYVVVGFADAA